MVIFTHFAKNLTLHRTDLEVGVLVDLSAGQPDDLAEGGQVHVGVVHEEQVDGAADLDALLAEVVVELSLWRCGGGGGECHCHCPLPLSICMSICMSIHCLVYNGFRARRLQRSFCHL